MSATARPTTPAPPADSARSLDQLRDALEFADSIAWAEGLLSRLRASAGDGARFMAGLPHG